MADAATIPATFPSLTRTALPVWMSCPVKISLTINAVAILRYSCLRFNAEPIRIPPERKTAPNLFQPLLLKNMRAYGLFIRYLVKDLSQRVDDHGIAAMIDIVPVHPHPVHPHYIGLILDRPRLQQGLPGKIAPLRPVGDIDDQVIFQLRTSPIPDNSLLLPDPAVLRSGCLPAPHREPQVITNQQQHLPALDGSNKTLIPGRILLVLPRICKPVALVIIAITPVRQHPYQPVEIMFRFFYDNAAGEDDPLLRRHGLHPRQRRTIH